MKKRGLVMGMAAVIALATAVPAFAAGWVHDGRGWKYATNPTNTQWMSGQWMYDSDGKHYYLGSDGYMLSNTYTPDGYWVTESGAWDGKAARQAQTQPSPSQGVNGASQATAWAQQQNAAAAQSGFIGEAAAKKAALSHAGLTENQVTYAFCKLDFDDGRWEYEVEFYTSDYREYDYDIDAYTGSILKFDYDAEYINYPAAGGGAANGGIGATGNYIGEARAKQIALERAGVSANSIYAYKCKLDIEYYGAEYEVEFKSGGYEYEVDINAVTGTILKFEREWD